MAKGRKRFLAAAAVVAAAAVILVLVFTTGGGSNSQVQASDTGTERTSIQPDEVPGGDQPTGTQVERSAAAEYLLKQGYKLGQFSFTVDKPVYTERGAASVSEKPLLSIQELKDWIQGGSDRAKAYLKHVKESMSDADLERIRKGEGFVRVQLLVPSEYTSNSFLSGGQVVDTHERRSVESGDIIFLYVKKPVKKKQPNGREEDTTEVMENGNTRGACGNVHAVPVPTTGPPAPPITVPPSKTPGGPGSGKPPHEGPGEPGHGGKPQIPLEDFPGGHEAGHGADLPPDKEKEYQGGPPRETKQDPPVKTPPGTGGKVSPGGSPPVSDSEGGTVSEPTAPPTEEESLPESKTPPPAPSEGAPPPPPNE